MTADHMLPPLRLSASNVERGSQYKELKSRLSLLLEGEDDWVAAMSTVSCELHSAFEYFHWTGFYCAPPSGKPELRIGPYQGSHGCLRIPFAKGVCGAAARTKRTQFVPDVHAFPGHIACASSTQSEVVVPILSPKGTLIAVLDIDSDHPAAFTSVDQDGLEALCDWLGSQYGPSWEAASTAGGTAGGTAGSTSSGAVGAELRAAGGGGGGSRGAAPRPWRLRHFIDSHKAATGVYILLLMAFYDAWSLHAAWLYLALHGSYGLMWLLKSRTFGDLQWEQPTSFWYGVGAIWPALTLYWFAPWLLISREVVLPGWYAGACVASWGLGIFLHFASDMQKHVALALRPGRLVTDGLWNVGTRNPNYFGELLIYLGFQLLAVHWLPLLCLAALVGAYWLPNMKRKDASLARYPEFAAWKARTALFIPWLF